MSKEVADILDRCADRLSKPGAWTRKELARDAKDRSVHPRERSAVCWCASGAIILEAGPGTKDSLSDLAFSALERVVGGNVPSWNDYRAVDPADVAAAFRRAAKAERENAPA